PSVDSIYRRFSGAAGAAYLVGGFGFTALNNDEVVVMPVRSGLGARLGFNLGYLKFTPESTWNPF
ncbi:MAG: EipA family protein, partial [Methylocystis sp.]